jgi:aldehyde:ferredoxin oxidoreductase
MMADNHEYFGWVGGILYVDLTTRRIWKEPLDIELAKKFIGGPAIGINILLNLLKPKIHPLSPENVMVFGTGPLVGTGVMGSGKCYLNTKYTMPASRDGEKYFISTSMYGSNRFGQMMKNAGYDHIVITGRSEKPCYLKVIDDDVEICDAQDLWGKDLYTVGDILRQRHPGKTGTCGTWVIGPAGENQVVFALAFTDDFFNAGRYAAAVAGSKNLKAIITLGSKGIRIANPKKHGELDQIKRTECLIHPNYSKFRKFGDHFLGRLLTETRVKVVGCSGGECGCKSVHTLKSGPYEGSWFGGIFVTFPAVVYKELDIPGAKENMDASFKFTEMLSKYGLCGSSIVNVLRYIKVLCRRGLIKSEDMGGLEFKDGDINFYLALLDKITKREDIGAIIAEGWYPMSEKLGVDAASDWEAGVPITKGVDPMVDARVWPSPSQVAGGFSPAFGLGPTVHAKGKQNHSHTYWSREQVPYEMTRKDAELMGITKEEFGRIFTDHDFNTGRMLKYGEDAEDLYNVLGICSTCQHAEKDPIRDVYWLAEVYTATTGNPITPRELLKAGEIACTLEKLINIREGFNREDDKIPPLYIQNTVTPLKTRKGDRYMSDWFGNRLTEADMEKMLDDYYIERGWDVKTGLPTKEKLIELGLDYLI